MYDRYGMHQTTVADTLTLQYHTSTDTTDMIRARTEATRGIIIKSRSSMDEHSLAPDTTAHGGIQAGPLLRKDGEDDKKVKFHTGSRSMAKHRTAVFTQTRVSIRCKYLPLDVCRSLSIPCRRTECS